MEHIRALGMLAIVSRVRLFADRMAGEVEALYQENGIIFKPKWFPLFTLLAARPGQTMSDAARMLGHTHAAVHLNAKEMQKERLIRIRKSSDDERSKLLELTEIGEALLKKMMPVWNGLEARLNQLEAENPHPLLASLEWLELHLFYKPLYQQVEVEKIPIQTTDIPQKPETSFLKPKRPEVTVRLYEDKDQPAFQSLNEAWLTKYFQIEPEDSLVLGDPETHILTPGGSIWMAEVNGKTVGTVALIRHADSSLELAKMAVDEAYQGHGIGRKLGEAVIAAAKKRGARMLYIISNDTLKNAMKLYAKLGFTHCDIPKHVRYKRGNITLELAL